MGLKRSQRRAQAFRDFGGISKNNNTNNLIAGNNNNTGAQRLGYDKIPRSMVEGDIARNLHDQ